MDLTQSLQDTKEIYERIFSLRQSAAILFDGSTADELKEHLEIAETEIYTCSEILSELEDEFEN